MQFEEGHLYVSVDFRMKLYSISSPVSPKIQLYEGDIYIEVTRHNLTVILSDGLCNQDITCMMYTNFDESYSTLDISEALYVGGVSKMTPYIRSKLKTTAGFKGCLGVRNAMNNSISLDFSLE